MNKNLLHDCGHMTKSSAMLIYGKNALIFSFLESVEQFQRNFVCSIRDYSPSLFVQIFTLG